MLYMHIYIYIYAHIHMLGLGGSQARSHTPGALSLSAGPEQMTAPNDCANDCVTNVSEKIGVLGSCIDAGVPL